MMVVVLVVLLVVLTAPTEDYFKSQKERNFVESY